ncbi:MAG TPA: hypothetical protein VD963_09420 [Phycisphaerales bacterium]|nr:hypothetical protein [Phycisphaerales bacterium]
MHTRSFRTGRPCRARPAWAAVVLALALAATGTAQTGTSTPAPAAAAPPPMSQFVRVVESKDGRRLALELVRRTFVHPDPAKPRLTLAGAVHIADRSFYETLQARLDPLDLVLFEGVKPPGAQDRIPADLDDAGRAKLTTHRVRLLATLAEAYRAEHGRYPPAVEALSTLTDKKLAWLATVVRTDAWGRPILYAPPARTPAAEPAEAGSQHGAPGPGEAQAPGTPPDIRSLGSDGAPGGEGPAADIAYRDMEPVAPDEVPGADEGIQEQMATALGLVFQLSAMDHGRPNWRNSDMTLDQVQERLEAAGAESGALFKMLDGSSFQAKLAGFLLKMLGSSPQGSAMMKLMLLEMLAHADELLTMAPGELGVLMQVILHERNEVVMGDLSRVIAEEPGVRTVGIIYGAGHLPGIQHALVSELGYRPAEEEWIPAIRIDLDKAGISAGQARQLRGMIGGMLEQQIKAFQRQQERGTKRGWWSR